MTDASRTRAPRDPVRTRRLLLDAAAAAVAEHGTAVSLEVVARAAGISKSGLAHHYGSKDDLFAALAVDAYDRFARDVDAQVDPADLAPGRVMRGYLRATFASWGEESAAPDYWAVEAQLSVVPAVAEAIREQGEAWLTWLSADGFDPALARILLLAATGADVAAAVGLVRATDAGSLQADLIRLTHADTGLAALLAGTATTDADGGAR